jgi:hypothetical protein
MRRKCGTDINTGKDELRLLENKTVKVIFGAE